MEEKENYISFIRMGILKRLRIIFSLLKKFFFYPNSMQECLVAYIPERLRKNGRPPIDRFDIGEYLYLRCKPTVLSNPYTGISIVELSHNRGGLRDDILCNPDDVLYSIKIEEPFEKYITMVVCTLEIINLNDENKYRKIFSEEKTGVKYEGVMELLHEPDACMYPHSVF